MGNFTQIGLEYIPWRFDMGNSSRVLGPHSFSHRQPGVAGSSSISAYAYSVAIIAVYAVVVILLVVVQFRTRRRDPIAYDDDDLLSEYREDKELLDEEEESRSLLRLNVQSMSGLKDAYEIDKMPTERV